MANKPRKPSGYVIYQGPSLLDGAPIICIVTVKSRNTKTANMAQTWILRADVSPLAANRSGADFSICGNCPSKGIPTDAPRGTAKKRKCYVQLQNAPTSVWQAFRRGSYPIATGHAAIAAIGKDRMVRFGAYGDQSAVPAYIADSLESAAKGHTAYSHQSAIASSSFAAARYMISADNLSDAFAAWAQGARTFRVLKPGETRVKGQEINCPSLKGVHCVDCGLCNGAKANAKQQPKSIVIPAHGAGKAHFA